MKKALSKLSAPKKLVRRVLSKRTTGSVASNETDLQNQNLLMTEEVILAHEIDALKDQIENLKAAIGALQDETEKKEIALARIAREKEKLTLDLLKQRRSNSSLARQLQDERKYYFKEKEMYCHEMNELKKLKRAISSSTAISEAKSIEEYKSEIAKLKETLNQTLEANYNLSIKFLRMKNTKTCLKTELKTMKLEHEKLINDYKTKIENMSTQLNDMVNEKLKTPMSCSSKKYLQLVKQNSCLVYENLCLQLEVDNLTLKYEKMKLEKTKSETNSRLNYIKHLPERPHNHNSKTNNPAKEKKRVRIVQETPEKLEKEPLPSCSSSSTHYGKNKVSSEEILKIFERNKLPGMPQIKIINEKENGSHSGRSRTETESRCKEDFQKQRQYVPNLLSKNNSKLTLFQVSNLPSQVSMSSSGLSRTRSSPEILQSTLFKQNANK